MSSPVDSVQIAMRIPGRWTHPKDLVKNMPSGWQLKPDFLVSPDGTEIDLIPAAADHQFAEIFRNSLRQPATRDELNTVDNYTVNILLSGPGGSMASANTMMQAAAAVIRAGGAGVFIDNGAIAHGGQNWLAMTDDGGPDALSFAYVSIIRSRHDIYTMGMHALGLHDIVMKRDDIEIGGFDIVEVIRYMSASEREIGNGHILADPSGPKFRAVAAEDARDIPADSPMFNPFGRLKLVSMRDLTEAN